ncbi:hypothetical protein B0H65DRAFT_417863 [Neurospora tetraspora]|uniref:Uncharacterized protein n=1 Tax=Neurospora tetraspora TaxID=94610 RepID=A0AAE0JQU9_9PEZI|nr:hypothetical protein B0H65DRAFT_417863 [Neurospora tetraspora]
MSSPPPPPSTSQPLALAAAASSLAEKARSTSQLIEKTLLPPTNTDPKPDPSNPYPSNPSLTKLTNLSAKLLQFNQHANTLGDCLTSASASGVADVLARTLDKALTRCDQGVEVVRGQVEWLGREKEEGGLAAGKGQGQGKEQKGKKEEVDRQAVEEYEALLIAYSRLFIFGSQILTVGKQTNSLDEKEQAEWMAKNDVDKIINKAEESAQKVLLGKSILKELQ